MLWLSTSNFRVWNLRHTHLVQALQQWKHTDVRAYYILLVCSLLAYVYDTYSMCMCSLWAGTNYFKRWRNNTAQEKGDMGKGPLTEPRTRDLRSNAEFQPREQWNRPRSFVNIAPHVPVTGVPSPWLLKAWHIRGDVGRRSVAQLCLKSHCNWTTILYSIL